MAAFSKKRCFTTDVKFVNPIDVRSLQIGFVIFY